MSANYKVGTRVWVIPIDEKGIVSEIRSDDCGVPIYVVVLDGGLKTHLCRECEIALA